MRVSSLYLSAASLLLLALSLCASSAHASTAASAAATAAVASGRVVSLSGESEKGIVVRAVEWDTAKDAPVAAAPVEETLTDAAGEYSLRALQAGRVYRVVIKTAAAAEGAAEASSATDAAAAPASRLARSSPEWQSLRVDGSSNGAVRLVDFVAFRRSSTFDLTGDIVGLGAAGLKHLSSLEIQVALASSPAAVLRKTATLAPTLAYFEFLNLPADSYVVTVKSSLPTRTYTFAAPAITVNLAHGSVHVQAVVEVAFKMSSVAEMQGNSLFNGLLIVAALAALLYRDKSAALLRAATKSVQMRNVAPLRQQIASMLPSGNNSAQAAAASFAPAAAAAEETRGGAAGKKAKFTKKEKTHVSTFVRFDSLPSSVAQPDSPVTPPTPTPAPVPTKAPVERPRPTPVAKPAPAPAPVAAKPASTPAPRMQQPAPVQTPVQLPSPPPAQVDKVVIAKKEKPTKAAAPAPAPAVAVAVPTPVPAPAAAAPASTGAKFCSGCGNRRPDANAKFCSECGTKY